jgi:hypothetical protein
VATSYGEAGRCLQIFATSHVKREDPRLEVEIDDTGPREGQSYAVRLVPEGRGVVPSLEFTYAEVVEGRTQFSWCTHLAARLRAIARPLVPNAVDAHPAG